ncbi:MAG: aminoacetone oxidase family FAD-binding enzyme [Ruminococcaceae bacterium]|nr:aminoacetone oxidase family FAD-binding enzyme [Oscillospiraceae bacterium]
MADYQADLAIIGGGAAGMAAAITAARLLKPLRGARIILLERLDRVGKKILATGNGRCNLTNAVVEIQSYHGLDPRFALGALHRFDNEAAISLFRELGMLCRTEPDGRVFPYSLQASTVLDTLRHAVSRAGVELRTGFEVKRLEAAEPLYIGTNPLTAAGGFHIYSTNAERLTARYALVTTGGCASPALGSNGSGYKLLQALGHEMVPVRPAIVQITTETKFVKPLSGVKIQGRARLLEAGSEVGKKIVKEARSEAGKEIGSEAGEILFTDDGLSGPPILQLAHLVSERLPSPESASSLALVLDFMPEFTENEIFDLLTEFAPRSAGLNLGDVLSGLLPKKAGTAIIKTTLSRPLSEPAASLSKAERRQLAAAIKNLPIRVTGTRGFAFAQVTAGGIATAGFRPDTLESKLVPGLYAAGEILDIDGDCGGFNLQWAWASGVLAATRAATALLEGNK